MFTCKMVSICVALATLVSGAEAAIPMQGKGLLIDSLRARSRRGVWFRKSAEWQLGFYGDSNLNPSPQMRAQFTITGPTGTQWEYPTGSGTMHSHYSDDEIMAFVGGLGTKWIAVRSSDGIRHESSEFTQSLVNSAHSHNSMKILGWVVLDGSDKTDPDKRLTDIQAEADHAVSCLDFNPKPDGLIVVPRWYIHPDFPTKPLGYRSTNMTLPYNPGPGNTTSAYEFAKYLAGRVASKMNPNPPFIAYMPFFDPPVVDTATSNSIATYDSEMIKGFDDGLAASNVRLVIAPRVLWYGGNSENDFRDEIDRFKDYCQAGGSPVLNHVTVPLAQAERVCTAMPSNQHPGHNPPNPRPQTDKNTSFLCKFAFRLDTPPCNFPGMGVYHLDGMITADLLDFKCLNADINSQMANRCTCGNCNSQCTKIVDVVGGPNLQTFLNAFKANFPGSCDYAHPQDWDENCVP